MLDCATAQFNQTFADINGSFVCERYPAFPTLCIVEPWKYRVPSVWVKNLIYKVMLHCYALSLVALPTLKTNTEILANSEDHIEMAHSP